MEDIRALVLAARGGALDACRTLVDRFAEMAFGAAMGRLGDIHLAQDAAQEAFLEAFKGLDKLQDPAAFAGWFRVIVFRQAARIGRRKKAITSGLDAAAMLADKRPGPLEMAQRNEIAVQLQRAMAVLPEAHRVVVRLFYLQGEATAAIAEKLEVPVSTVKKRLHDARAKLRRGLGSKYAMSGAVEKKGAVSEGGGRSARCVRAVVKRVQVETKKEEKAMAVMQSVRKERKRRLAPSRPRPIEVGELDGLWKRYKETEDKGIRNRLLEHYHSLVKYHATRMAARLPNEVDVEDLVSAGTFGLMDAIGSFDPERGIKFETFCAQRIRGAIIDELRALDWVPRLVRRRSSEVSAVRNSLNMELGRLPSEEEIAGRLNVDAEEFRRMHRDAATVSMVSLSRKWNASDSSRDTAEVDLIRDPAQVNPLSALERLNVRSVLLHGMSRSERLIVMLYYFENLTMREIGAALDLSESRVSQMHKSIMDRLKAQVMAHADEFEFPIAG